MKLYGYYRSSASYRIRIVLHAKGLDYDYVPIELTKDAHKRAEFLIINPQGFVPALQDGQNIISQSPAIAEYLEETYPHPALLPTEPLPRARVREAMHVVGCDIHPLQNLRVLRYLASEFGQQDEGIARWGRTWVGAGFDTLEKLAGDRSTDGKYSLGQSLTLADVWLIPQMFNARRFELDLEPFPTLRSIEAHCLTLEPFKAAHPNCQPDTPPTAE